MALRTTASAAADTQWLTSQLTQHPFHSKLVFPDLLGITSTEQHEGMTVGTGLFLRQQMCWDQVGNPASFHSFFPFWALTGHSPRDGGRTGQVKEPGGWQQLADSANTSRVFQGTTPCWILVPTSDCTGLALSPGWILGALSEGSCKDRMVGSPVRMGMRCGNPGARIVLRSWGVEVRLDLRASAAQPFSDLESWCVPTEDTGSEVLRLVPSPCTGSRRQFRWWSPEMSELGGGLQIELLAALLWLLCCHFPLVAIRLPFC